jgi:prolyl-tRNA synthetase
LQVQRAIEVGHIFKLGYKYSDALDVTVLDPSGERVKVIMGSYGIGVERAMAAIVEGHHDGKGIVWPMAVAPFQVAVVVAQSDDATVAETGERIYQQLLAEGVEVVIDDRAERAGVKFRDVELVGVPLRITVGKRTLADGFVELTDRASGQTDKVPLGQVIEIVRKAIESAR